MFWQGLLFGLVLQLSVGPVCLAVLGCSMNYGTKEAWKMVCGVTLVDMLYILAALLGTAKLLELFWFRKTLLWLGATILIRFGLAPFLQDKLEFIEATPPKNSFVTGCKLTLTNPLTIVFWTGTFGALLASGQLVSGMPVFYFSLGCITSTAIFLSLVVKSGGLLHSRLNKKTTQYLNRVVGVFLLVFGIRLLFM